jgi:hypothetical protein
MLIGRDSLGRLVIWFALQRAANFQGRHSTFYGRQRARRSHPTVLQWFGSKFAIFPLAFADTIL